MFASHSQIEAISNVKILVCDATFELTPKPFQQIFTIQGLVWELSIRNFYNIYYR
jgi:hypothetical protein